MLCCTMLAVQQMSYRNGGLPELLLGGAAGGQGHLLLCCLLPNAAAHGKWALDVAQHMPQLSNASAPGALSNIFVGLPSPHASFSMQCTRTTIWFLLPCHMLPHAVYAMLCCVPCLHCAVCCVVQVAMYQRVQDKATGVPRWTYIDRKQPHTHDVRSLATLLRPEADPLLLSGGNDGQIVLYSMPRFLQEHPIRQSRSPQLPLLQLSTGDGPAVLMQVHQREVSLWQLGRAAAAQPPVAGLDTGDGLAGC